jgi:hypothetical protein
MGNRFVQEEHGRFADEGAAKRHPLLLATAQLCGHPAEEHVNLEHSGDRADALIERRRRVPVRCPRRAERKGEVLVDGKVRIESVSLKGHRHIAIPGVEVGRITAADENLPASRLEQACDQM